MKVSKTDYDEALLHLADTLKPGDTVYTILRHVSASGMSRSIDVLVIRDNDVRVITWCVSCILGEPLDTRNGGLKVSGCGMDMGFNVVYRLGSRLWPNGTPEPHGTRNGEPDTAGGYALRHRWL